jgi:hypothetical protein
MRTTDGCLPKRHTCDFIFAAMNESAKMSSHSEIGGNDGLQPGPNSGAGRSNEQVER